MVVLLEHLVCHCALFPIHIKQSVLQNCALNSFLSKHGFLGIFFKHDLMAGSILPVLPYSWFTGKWRCIFERELLLDIHPPSFTEPMIQGERLQLLGTKKKYGTTITSKRLAPATSVAEGLGSFLLPGRALVWLCLE